MSNEMPECGISPEKLLAMHKCINELWAQNIYCDVTIKVQGEVIRAHGGVVCAHSTFFREKLKDIKGEKIVEITGMNPEVVRKCIGFMYTGDIEVTIDDLDSVATAAKIFTLTQVTVMCEQALSNDVEICSAMPIRRIATRHGWKNLVEKVEHFLSENTIKILMSDVFVFYSKEEFMWLLRNKMISHPLEEMQVWTSVIRWTQFNLKEREKDFFEVLKLVKLDNLSVAFMNDMIRREQIVMRSQECMKYLLQHLFSRLTANGNQDIDSSHWPDVS